MEFVTFEIAKRLKRKGFRMPCIAHYCSLDGNVLKFNITIGCIRGSNVKRLNDESNIYTDAPTISQALKWLSEEKKIFVEIALSPEGYRHIIYSGVYCTNTSSAFYFSFDGFYNHENNYMTYEQAALAGIKYVLDNLI